MNNPVVLSIDLGTQSVRAVLVDKNGNILSKTQYKYQKPYYSLYPGWAEQKPDVYWDSVCLIINEMKKEAADIWDKIIAVTVTTMRDSCLCVDKEGKPLRDMILWLDKRQYVPDHDIPRLNSFAFSIAGMKDTAELIRKASACNWLSKNEPEIWEKTYKFIFVSGYLICKLTGRLVDSVANMIGHIPFNSKTRTWMGSNELNRCLFNIESDKLPDVIEPGETLGFITEEASQKTGIPQGLPVIATGSDVGCATLGLSCLKSDSAAIEFGTTATIQFTLDRFMEPLPFIPAYPAVLKGHYNPEVQIYRGYWLISWFKNQFATKEVEEAARLGVPPEELLDEMIKKIPAGSDGLIFQPYFTPGVIMPKAKGAITGFSDVHTRVHLYRAIIEGINFALMDGLYTMQRRGKVDIKKLFLAGGGSQSNTICQIAANMFGLPAYRIQTSEASGLGSSIVAFASKGVYADAYEAVEKMVRIKDEFLPDYAEHKTYKYLFDEIFSKIFDKMLPLYRRQEMAGEIKVEGAPDAASV